MQSEPNSPIRSHRERVQKANQILRENPMYNGQPISNIDREAFVELLLLEDVGDLFDARAREEKAIEPQNQSEAQKKAKNIKKYEAIRNLFDEAVEIAIFAINEGNYKAVWQNIPEKPLMVAAKRVDKSLPKLRAMGCEIVKSICDAVAYKKDDDLRVRIDELIREAEEAIPDKKWKSGPKSLKI